MTTVTTELRKSGISVVGDVPWGTHFCHFYETKEDLLDILVPYFKIGLENGEFCIWVVSDPLGEAEARDALRQAVPEADRYLAAGHIEIVPHTLFPSSRQRTPSAENIEIIPHTDWYLKGGAFIAERVLNGWNQKLADALAKGYAGLRANGNEAWLTEENWKAFSEYEKTLDENLAGQRMIVLCSYPLSGSSAAQILDVVNTHQLAIVRRGGKWEIVETPELTQAKQEIQRLNQESEQRVIERTRELAAANEELRREIAERKRAEEALRQSEDRLRLVIDTIPTMAWSIRPDGTIAFLNQRWLDYTGLSLEEEIEEPTHPMHPDDIPRALEKWRRDMAAGEPSEDEVRLRRADGEYRWFLVRTAPLRDEQGNLVKWYGVSTDIEDLKRAEAALKESQLRLEEAQRIAHVGHWDRDLETGRITWSDEIYRILGLPLEERDSVRTEWLDVVHPEDRQRLSLAIEEMQRGIRRFDVEFRIVRPNGEVRFLHSQGGVIRDERGRPLRMFGTAQDITESKRAEEQLKATNEQLRALSASLQFAREEEGIRIARELHDELGSALTSLKWDLEGMEKTLSDPKSGPELASMKKKAKAMKRLVDSTIDVVRRISAELRPSALDDLGLVPAIELHAQQFQARTGIVCNCDFSSDKVGLNQEQSTAVFRILQEALTNVLRHAQATRVDIRAAEEDGEFILTISDNGKGISEDEASGVHSLGLLGMRERAILIGGKIDIAGVEGKGTVITLRVPIGRAGRASGAGK